MTWPALNKFLRAGVASIAAGVVDMAVLVAMVESGTRVPLATFIAAVCGAVIHFALSKSFAFRDRSPVLGQMLRFTGVSLATAALLALAMQLFAVALGMPYVLAKLQCSVLVFAAWTYPAQRYLVFRRIDRLLASGKLGPRTIAAEQRSNREAVAGLVRRPDAEHELVRT
jgi:putative flippase GtrA